MKQQLFIALTAANAVMLLFSVFHGRSTAAQDIPPVLKARSLEIVDESGRVRAAIKIFPRDPTVKMPDGSTGYPETVLLRLFDSKGRPIVKIAATEDGSAINVGGESDPTGIQLLARGDTSSLKLSDKDGKQKLFKASEVSQR